MDGTPTGEYGNKVFTNNIYDPKIISDKEFINRGIEAANDAKLKTSDGRKQKLMVKESVMYDYIGCFYLEGGKLICKHLKLGN